MKKETIQIITTDGQKIYRITTLDERWYSREIINEKGLPETKFYPSSTWISSYYPKGIAFYRWLAEKGWDEAEAIKQAAGDRGSKVHCVCGDIDKGIVIDIQKSKYINPSTEQEEELTPDELDCIMAYRDWTDEVKPELLASEITAFNEKEEYAGTADKIYRIKGEIYIVDIKTGQTIWPEWELQVASYGRLDIDYKSLGIADEEWQNKKLAVLQIGYRRNLKRYKFTELEDKFGLFLNAKEIWRNENPEAKPKQRDFPLIIQSEFRAENLVKKSEIKVAKIK